MHLSDAERLAFIAHTEGKISPKDVGKLYQRAEMLAKLPISIQKWIVGHAGGDDPYIGFVVEPYAFFLSYEITDPSVAAGLLPPDYRLVPTAMFDGTPPRPTCIIGAFNVHTSVFWGSRVEVYVIAEHTGTGMLSWLICDYESNTISYDPGQGFSGASTARSVITTSPLGEVVIDVRSGDGSQHLTAVADLGSGTARSLDQRLWVEGNLSVDYGGRLMEPGSVPFGLVFDPREMASALDIPLEAVTIATNTFGRPYRAEAPFEAACFPYAQHFLTTSYPEASPVRDAAGLVEAVRRLVAPSV